MGKELTLEQNEQLDKIVAKKGGKLTMSSINADPTLAGEIEDVLKNLGKKDRNISDSEFKLIDKDKNGEITKEDFVISDTSKKTELDLSASEALKNIGTNVEIITGSKKVNDTVYNAFSAVMGDEDIEKYQASKKYQSFNLKIDGKIGAMTTQAILSDAIKIIGDKNDPKYEKVSAAFKAIYGEALKDEDLIKKIQETQNSLKSDSSWAGFMKIGLDISSGTAEDFAMISELLFGKKYNSFEEYKKENISVTIPSSNYDVSNKNNGLRGFTTGNEQYDQYILDFSKQYNIDPLLIYAQMAQESSYKVRATSYKGASGLMQLMPATARRFGVTDIYDPKQNIEAGVKYMRWLLNKFDQNVELALAGYNAGEGAVMKHGYKIPPFKETREYVARITNKYNSIVRV